MPSRSAHRGRAALALLAGLGLATSSAADEGVCGPFDAGARSDGPEVCSEPGVLPGSGGDAGDWAKLPAAQPPERRLVRPGEALIALPKGLDGALPSGLELEDGVRVVRSFFSPVLCATVAAVSGPGERTPDEMVAVLPGSAVVVPHHVYLPAADEVRPLGGNVDPYRGLQYALDRIEVERMWSVGDGAGVTVALLDSRPDAGHRDLSDLRTLPIEPGRDTPATHGTLMAGVIGADRGNGFGIAGVAPGADLAAVPVCGSGPADGGEVCPLYDVLRGIDVAWGAQARVVNLSIVGPSNPLLERAVSRLERLGVMVVAAAGNETTAQPRYPAAYPSVIGVGAVDVDGELYARSNRGLSVQLLAPGVDVVSTVPGGFAFGNGTSLAAAHVSGLLALLASAGVDPVAARRALLGDAPDPAGPPPRLPAACEAFARAGGSCSDPAP